MTSNHTPIYVETLSGNIVDLGAAVYSNLSLEDIFNTLSVMKRFNGRSRNFDADNRITVLQHSYAVYRYMRDVLHSSEEEYVYALMHDAHEALVGDIITPISNAVPEFREWLQSVQNRVLGYFGVNETWTVMTEMTDQLALEVEWAEFVAQDEQVVDRNARYYSANLPTTMREPSYKAYLSILKEAMAKPDDELVKECLLIVYGFIARKHLSDKHAE